jgi:Carboxypeptidase regulatory-like domain
MWNAIAYVTSGLALVAFIVAVAAQVYKHKADQAQRLIQQAPEAQRPRLIENAFEFFRIDTKGLTKKQNFELAMKQIDAKSHRYAIQAKTVLAIAVLISAVAALAIYMSYAEGKSIDDREEVRNPANNNANTSGEIRQDNQNNNTQTNTAKDQKLSQNRNGIPSKTSSESRNSNISLSSEVSSSVHGRVEDEEGKPIKGADVSVVASGAVAGSATTNDSGMFQIQVNIAKGEPIDLHVKREGFQTITQGHIAGSHRATIVLRVRR